ncbi:integral membrane protein [Gaeumannomyces tritici R3-111a-1]|uniref:Integral membrane protein n=1 Tax=Gaeumannomyces tritici (strain R3-111a-1) TaxID=644352 RepID=J3NSN0_GAET3|nr:integral membrane protein [Gaeumannomyces tritici R3-111a-1]EJT79193.1 integral membrane protein [Gaeumannomyces tritici R3-111a-1]
MALHEAPRALRAPGRAAWDRSVPPLLRPMLRAWALGYGSSVAPRVLTLVIQTFARGRNLKNTAQQPRPPFLRALIHILCGGLDPQRFPTFCALLVGGTTLLQVPLSRLVDKLLRALSKPARTRISRWLATFVAGWCSLRVLQSKHSPAFTDVAAPSAEAGSAVTVRWAGRTLDLTLFAATRAVDVIVGEVWSQRRGRRIAAGKWTAADRLVERTTDPAIFATACAAIMWAWIYLPDRLPPGYNKWIGAAAAVDVRLLEALRRCRSGELLYGQDNGQASLLQAMCADYKWPLHWGDPSQSVPFPCEMVHMGAGASCEQHALSRFYRSWRWSMATYMPLNLLIVARNPNLRSLARAAVSASRSSAFLGTFITLFYYGVCLARTRLGPSLLVRGDRDLAARQRIDGGLCVGVGCALCGWSILIEHAGRRKDMALFVAPRALATFFPRRYSLDKQWRETLLFAASTAVVFTCALENQPRVRGVLGNVIGSVLKA